jgi:hypothetical protein
MSSFKETLLRKGISAELRNFRQLAMSSRAYAREQHESKIVRCHPFPIPATYCGVGQNSEANYNPVARFDVRYRK